MVFPFTGVRLLLYKSSLKGPKRSFLWKRYVINWIEVIWNANFSSMNPITCLKVFYWILFSMHLFDEITTCLFIETHIALVILNWSTRVFVRCVYFNWKLKNNHLTVVVTTKHIICYIWLHQYCWQILETINDNDKLEILVTDLSITVGQNIPKKSLTWRFHQHHCTVRVTREKDVISNENFHLSRLRL